MRGAGWKTGAALACSGSVALATFGPLQSRSERAVFDVPCHLASAEAPIPMLEVQVNGEGPFQFILDTGNGEAAPLVSPSLVERLGLPTQAGKDAQSLARVQLASLAVGPHRLGPL